MIICKRQATPHDNLQEAGPSRSFATSTTTDRGEEGEGGGGEEEEIHAGGRTHQPKVVQEVRYESKIFGGILKLDSSLETEKIMGNMQNTVHLIVGDEHNWGHFALFDMALLHPRCLLMQLNGLLVFFRFIWNALSGAICTIGSVPPRRTCLSGQPQCLRV